jgi:hypothetical protein
MRHSGTTYSTDRIAMPCDDLATALGIYARSTVPSIRTATNDIVYWAAHYNSTFDDELLLFAFRINGVIVGYAELVLFRTARMLVVDYIAIDEACRGNNAFFEFVHQILAYLDANSMAYDHILTEVASFSDSDEPLPEARSLIRLLKLSGFGVLKARYYQPPLGLMNPESRMRATLLIRRDDPQPFIMRETFLHIVNTIYYKHYLRWYEDLPGCGQGEYRKCIDRLFAQVESEAPRGRVEINGSWEWVQDARSAKAPSQRAFLASKPFVVLILAVFAALSCAQAILKLNSTSVALLVVLALVVVFSVFAVFSSHARHVFRDIMAVMVRLSGKPK